MTTGAARAALELTAGQPKPSIKSATVVFTVQIPPPDPGADLDRVICVRGDRVGLLLTRDAARALVRSLTGFLEGTR